MASTSSRAIYSELWKQQRNELFAVELWKQQRNELLCGYFPFFEAKKKQNDNGDFVSVKICKAWNQILCICVYYLLYFLEALPKL